MLDDEMTFWRDGDAGLGRRRVGCGDGGPDWRTWTRGRVKAFHVEAIEEINERDARPETEFDAARDCQRIGAASIEESGGGFSDELIPRAAVEIYGESPSEPNNLLGRAAGEGSARLTAPH